MALSGSQSINIHGGAHTLIVEWSASQNTSGNYSTVNANLYIRGNYSYSTIYSGSVVKPVALVINGNRKSGSARIDISGTEKRLLLSHSVNVGHNSDGTKTFRLEGMLNSQITWSGTYYGSEQWTRQDWGLNRIPRASTFNQSADTFNMDGDGVIKIFPASTSFTHKLYMAFGNKKVLLKDNPPVNQNFSVHFKARDFADQIPNADLGVGVLVLETYNGNTMVGGNQRTTYLRLPTNYVPSQPSVSVSDESSVPTKLGVSKTAGIYVKGMSSLRFNCSSSGVLGSKIANYQVQIGGQTFSSSNGTINVDLTKVDVGVGKVRATVKAIDSRGRTNQNSVELNIREYKAPTIQNFSVARQDNGDVVIITKKAKVQKIVASNRTVLATNYEYSQGAIDTYSKAGYTGTWTTSTPLSNLTIGETVLLQLYNTTKCDNDLIIATVNTINSNSVSATSTGGLDNSTSYNSYTVRTEYKLSSANTWTAWKTETDSSATIISGGWNVANSYDIRITLVDKLNQTVVQASISTAKVLLDFNKDIGVGIGKMHERGVLDVGGDIHLNGNVLQNGSIWSGSLPAGNTTTKEYWHKFPRGRSLWWYGNDSNVKNTPASWGFVEVSKGNGGDFSVLWYSQDKGRIYRNSGNSTNISGWNDLIQSVQPYYMFNTTREVAKPWGDISFPWQNTIVQGNDLSVDSTDNTKIKVNRSGWYEFYISGTIRGATAGRWYDLGIMKAFDNSGNKYDGQQWVHQYSKRGKYYPPNNKEFVIAQTFTVKLEAGYCNVGSNGDDSTGTISNIWCTFKRIADKNW